jgi:branched-chain amino acid transport system substrate-binding protein
VEIFRKKNNVSPDALGALGADAYLIMLDAIERTGSTNPEVIRDALEKTTNFQGITGNISIDKNHDAIKSVVIRQVKGGNSLYVSSVNP